ncbi:MAG: alpha-L-fucosidase, partial [Muribaculaceae bacterium]|nr:alpha-L-fucosidase [Muribaculaceae bacterium]
MFKKIISLAIAAVSGISGALAWDYTPTTENLEAREQFRDHGFGIFLHWGIY